MPDRLPELLHQRALVREQLAWLDREIAEAQQGVPALPTKPVAQPVPGIAPAAATPAPVSNADADAILARYQQDSFSSVKSARRAIWCVFIIGLALVALGYFLYARHLGRWW